MPTSHQGDRRHVLVLLDTIDDMGGAETLAVELAIGLDPLRYRRTLCVTRWTDASETAEPGRGVADRLRTAGVEIVGLRRSSRADLRPWLRLRRFLIDEDVDVIHAHKYGSNAWGVLLGKLSRVPVVVAHEHMWSYDESNALRRFVDRRWIARGSSAFIAVSEEGRRQMIEIERVRGDDIVYIPNGVPELPDGSRAEARRTLGLAPDDPVVGTLANLRPEKALEVLAEATAALTPDLPGLRVVIVGEGPERERLEQTIRRLGLEQVVLLTGYRSDATDLLAAFDVAVCCSDFEGGPLSVMEYMDVGLAIVATRVGGLPELIEDDVSGVLVPPRDHQALADALGALLRDRARRHRLGVAARQTKRATHGLRDWITQMDELYAIHLTPGPELN